MPRTPHFGITREGTAHHEAGHGVASVRLGFATSVITIGARDESLGHVVDDPTFAVDYENDRVKTERETREDAAVVCYAGLAAQAHFGFGTYTWRRNAAHGAWRDDEIAREYLEQVFSSSDELRLAVERCRKRAVRLVARLEDDVRKVAEALLDVGTLTEGEIEAVLEIPSVAAASGAESLAEKRSARPRRSIQTRSRRTRRSD